MQAYKHFVPPVLLVFVMKWCIKMRYSLPHNHYCYWLPSPVCLPHQLMNMHRLFTQSVHASTLHPLLANKVEGEVAALFPPKLFERCEVRRKNFSSQISKNKVVFFTANEKDSVFHQYRRRRLKKKPLQCKALRVRALREIR